VHDLGELMLEEGEGGSVIDRPLWLRPTEFVLELRFAVAQ
jgi:hypothetical protein